MYGIPGYSEASEAYENREPEENEAVYAYHNSLNTKEQVDVCKEWLAHVGGDARYEEWLDTLNLEDTDDNLKRYCEEMDSFWDYVCA